MRRLTLLLALAPLLVAGTEPALPPEKESEHVVKPGETLGGIAARAKVPRILIIETNRLQPPYAVRAGENLTIPRTRHHTAGRGDTKFAVSYRYAVPWADIAVANGLDPAASLKRGQKLLIPTLIAPPPAPAAANSAERPEGRPHRKVSGKPETAVD